MSDPRITDEAVEAAAHSLYKSDAQGQWEHGELDLLLAYRDVARLALEAALPHLAPQPVVDRDALIDRIAYEFLDYPEGLSFVTALDGGILPGRQVAALAADAVLALLNGGAS